MTRYDHFAQRKMEAARTQKCAGLHRSDEEVAAKFAAKREVLRVEKRGLPRNLSVRTQTNE